jgi:hypothetical protein
MASHVSLATWVAPGRHRNFESHVSIFFTVRKKPFTPGAVRTNLLFVEVPFVILRTSTVTGPDGFDIALKSLYSRGEMTRDVLLGFGANVFRTGEAFSADRMNRGSAILGRIGDTEPRLTPVLNLTGDRDGVEGGLGVSIRFRLKPATTRHCLGGSRTTLTFELARNFFRFEGGPPLIIYYKIIVL